jgi:hypothetical protein
MNEEASKIFNDAADKVVSFKEMRQKTKALYKAELSLGEKFYLYAVSYPLSPIQAIAALVHGKPEGSYIDDQKFPPKLYANGAYMAAILKSSEAVSPKLEGKLNELSAKAFEQCEDISKTPTMKALKPV